MSVKNPPAGFEELTRRHFELKKDEILEITKQWVNESKKHRKEMEICRNELLKLYQVDDDVKSDVSSPKVFSEVGLTDDMEIDSSSEEEKIIIKKKKMNVDI